MARSVVTQTSPIGRERTRLKLTTRETIAAYLFLLPNLIGFLVFTVFAVIASAGISLTNWDLLSPPRFVGFENYQ